MEKTITFDDVVAWLTEHTDIRSIEGNENVFTITAGDYDYIEVCKKDVHEDNT